MSFTAETAAEPALPATPGTLIDLSMPIVEHWRFTAAFERSEKVAEGQRFHSTTLRIAAHAFTHVDAPLHVRADGAPLGEVDPGRLWGDAAVLDLSDLGDDVAFTAEHLEAAGGHVVDGDIVLLRSDHERRHPTTTAQYWTSAPWVDASAARWLAAKRVRAVGFDFPQDRATRSPYQPDFTPHDGGLSEDWACHHLLLDIGVPQIEYLTGLHLVATGRVRFFALPLNLPHGDGAPVRAFAITD